MLQKLKKFVVLHHKQTAKRNKANRPFLLLFFFFSGLETGNLGQKNKANIASKTVNVPQM